MKNTIRKILNENKFEKYFQMILDDVRDGKIIHQSEAIKKYGINDDLILVFQNNTIKKIKSLLLKPINIDDYPEVGLGTYSFRFKILKYDMTDEEHIIFDVEFLDDGDVTIISGEEDVNMTLIDALQDSDFGWEVEMEVRDIITSIIERILIPEIVIANFRVGFLFKKPDN